MPNRGKQKTTVRGTRGAIKIFCRKYPTPLILKRSEKECIVVEYTKHRLLEKLCRQYQLRCSPHLGYRQPWFINLFVKNEAITEYHV